jgi:transcriptional regulator with XRE-family HTH domain
MAHTTDITLTAAMARKKLTQQQLEGASGVDRTYIARLKTGEYSNPTIDIYNKLDTALRTLGVLRRRERLVFGQGQPESIAS